MQQNVKPLFHGQREGESYAAFTKRIRQLDAVAALNRTFEERRLEIAVGEAYTRGHRAGRTEGARRGLRVGHQQGYWWGFICGGCLAAVGGALAVIAWSIHFRGGVL